MEILEPEDFFARLVPRCIQVGPDTTMAELLSAGMAEEAAQEVLRYRELLEGDSG